MKLFASLVLAAVAGVAIYGVSTAQEGSDAKSSSAESTPSCCSKDGEAKCSCADSSASKEEGSCSKGCSSGEVDTAMAKLPKMSYVVAGESVCCPHAAEAMAEAKSEAIEYVVGEEKFETKQAAFTSLVEQTEAMVEEFTTPCKCEESGTTTIAGTKCNCPVKAGETTELVKKAVSEVHMAYAVGDETCNCPNKAAEMAKEAGVEKTFVVNGEKTSCEMTARLNLARAKYKAAVAAMVAQSQPAEQTATSGT